MLKILSEYMNIKDVLIVNDTSQTSSYMEKMMELGFNEKDIIHLLIEI